MRTRLSRGLIWRAAVVAVVAAATVVLGVRATAPAPTTTNTTTTGWELPRLGTSGDLRLADLRGRPLVVDFFASWCTACQGELPGFATVARQLTGAVTFAGVDSQENGDGLSMARTYGIDSWPLAVDVGGSQASGLHDALGTRGMPVTAFYDSGGHLLEVVPGAISEDDLKARLRSLYGVTVA